jgi:acetyl-CoA carboxylase carboxyltransferase component
MPRHKITAVEQGRGAPSGPESASVRSFPQGKKWLTQEDIMQKKKTLDDKIAELVGESARSWSGAAGRSASTGSTNRASFRRASAWTGWWTREALRRSGCFARHRATYFGMAEKELPADGVVTGCATIDGRLVHLASQDFTVAGGAAGETHCKKVADMMAMSLKTGSPFVFINDSGGARVQEGIDSLAGYARVFYNNVMLSGTVPQIALICGPCAGGAAYSPALTDFVIQTEQARMFITGPQVIKQVTGEEVSAEELGGPQSQMNYSGVVHLIARDDEEAIELAKRLLEFSAVEQYEDPPRLAFNFGGRLKADSEMNNDGSRGSEGGLRRARRDCARGGQRGFSGDSAGDSPRILLLVLDRACKGRPAGIRGQPAVRAGRSAGH